MPLRQRLDRPTWRNGGSPDTGGGGVELRCSSLMSSSGDPFREVEAAALCQRLGLLRQNVRALKGL